MKLKASSPPTERVYTTNYGHVVWGYRHCTNAHQGRRRHQRKEQSTIKDTPYQALAFCLKHQTLLQYGFTALMEGADKGHEHVVQTLLKAGAVLNLECNVRHQNHTQALCLNLAYPQRPPIHFAAVPH